MRPAAAILLAAILLAAPRPSRAEDLDLAAKKDYSSPQWLYFELKFGPYSPNIDDEFSNNKTPFQDLFGDGSSLMVGGELDVEIWRKFGTLAIGGQIGYYSNSAQNFKDDSPDGKTPTDISTAVRSAGESTLKLMPLALLAIYRFDLAADRWNIPIVPYAKFGLNYTFWWITKGDGSGASAFGTDGNGGTFGWQLNLGAALRLDILEPQAAKMLDVELGINHTYIFFEFAYIRADGFGSSKALNVGDVTYNGGIAFEL